jgi:hypothetical protein
MGIISITDLLPSSVDCYHFTKKGAAHTISQLLYITNLRSHVPLHLSGKQLLHLTCSLRDFGPFPFKDYWAWRSQRQLGHRLEDGQKQAPIYDYPILLSFWLSLAHVTRCKIIFSHDSTVSLSSPALFKDFLPSGSQCLSLTIPYELYANQGYLSELSYYFS